MFEQNPEFKLPSHDTKIWRFIDFTKFVSILTKNSLYFPRADMLGDPFEGTFTEATIKKTVTEIRTPEDKMSLQKAIIETPQFWKILNFVSCWHRNDFEPDSMWKSYTSNNQSVAIQTTVGNFKKCFEKTKHDVMIGEVEFFVNKLISYISQYDCNHW